MTTPGHANVARVLAQVLAEQYPGTTWTSADDEAGGALPGHVRLTLAGPAHDATLSDRDAVVRRAA